MNLNGHPPGLRHRALIQLLRTADALWDASRLFFARWGLGPSQFNVLNLLCAAPSGLSQTDLSRELIMHRSNVTGLVDRLEKRGLVRRRDMAGDRRAYRVVLTSQGSKLMQEILPLYHAAAERVWEKLPEHKISGLAAMLEEAACDAQRIVAAQHGPPTGLEPKMMSGHANKRNSGPKKSRSHRAPG